jgi:hypothetical protein
MQRTAPTSPTSLAPHSDSTSTAHQKLGLRPKKIGRPKNSRYNQTSTGIARNSSRYTCRIAFSHVTLSVRSTP